MFQKPIKYEFIPYGPHKGKRWTRAPRVYLFQLISDHNSPRYMVRAAKRELSRRSTFISTTVHLTPHSIDRASQITDEWKHKGVFSWLSQISEKAFHRLTQGREVNYRGFRFVFNNMDGPHDHPTLITIINKNGNQRYNNRKNRRQK